MGKHDIDNQSKRDREYQRAWEEMPQNLKKQLHDAGIQPEPPSYKRSSKYVTINERIK